ncbi:DUF6123 family protein [Sediminibacillus albus]|uniref:Uncharacterized protein n=1 Tax=Sediminibacillus albus TaxID=407036 RepID=A0A1G8VQN0_9BACI|nr:DUF6123 family protein [Sediminibacillus albus]SDJ68274.1 hypothetical protein SAMN05216243_0281 [Sediminibacillus albus]
MATGIEKDNQLGYFIEDLWAQGFRLSDKDVRFVYLGKNSTAAPEWKVIKALKVTLQFQLHFDGSFFLSVLELLAKDSVKNRKMANAVLKEKGFAIEKK